MKRRANVLGGLFCSGLAACSAILGIDDLPTAESAITSEAGASDSGQTDGSSSSSDSSIASDSGEDAGCHDGDTRCVGNVPQTCTGGAFMNGTECQSVCSSGECVNPPSCASLSANCGTSGNASCCSGAHVPGGTFYRSYDGTASFNDKGYPATVSDFVLDEYEVTVARFRQFAGAYVKPAAGTGRNPNDATDTGWDTSFDTSLPDTKAELEATLTTTSCAGSTYTTSAGANDKLPINCMTWYVAAAFCIWDGGRLPTEAEWNYAAAGGGDASLGQRVYPWSSPSTDTTIDATHAVYDTSAISAVGTHAAGNGRWSHADLAGNVREWAVDFYVSPYATSSCTDCADLTSSSSRVLRGGSYLSSNSSSLLVSIRDNSPATLQTNDVGMRCARHN